MWPMEGVQKHVKHAEEAECVLGLEGGRGRSEKAPWPQAWSELKSEGERKLVGAEGWGGGDHGGEVAGRGGVHRP